jgi:hypothetical protein
LTVSADLDIQVAPVPAVLAQADLVLAPVVLVSAHILDL